MIFNNEWFKEEVLRLNRIIEHLLFSFFFFFFIIKNFFNHKKNLGFWLKIFLLISNLMSLIC